MRFEINQQNPQERYIRYAAEVLREGGLVIYPTDTVYGLGCDLFNKKAVERIYQVKGFKKRKLLSFICPDLKDIAKYAYVSTPAYKIMRHLLPGPFTFILPATRLVPKILLEKKRTVGIRVPDDKICHALLEEFGNPVISTSARLSDQEYIDDPEDLYESFANFVDIFLDAGHLSHDVSSVIDLCDEKPHVIRRGAGKKQLEQILGL
ncbi:threonylcarbamoyl-AMP synthase [candidate division KSB1 bacterium]|nr:threonylcarbamoyl-AMP synthase [candidate division KSB1 bacterium]